MEQVPLSSLTLIQLKSVAYDLIGQSTTIQNQLKQVNSVIAEKTQAAALEAASAAAPVATPATQPAANTF